jgi:hypothetical protein
MLPSTEQNKNDFLNKNEFLRLYILYSLQNYLFSSISGLEK